jgi:protein-tyrosine phosphatase
LPGIDDGAAERSVSLDMARASVADGVTVVACTPHILPGLYPNTGPQILQATQQLQMALDEHAIPLRLATGADNHIVPDFVAGLQSGQLLPLASSRYVLVEPPHHVLPPRLEDMFFSLTSAGYVPILTHPERLSWINSHYEFVKRLGESGVWMQITAGSLAGAFGKSAQYWAERMLDEGLVHILATDAHDTKRRPPNLSVGRNLAAGRVGYGEAEHLVATRPRGVLDNVAPSSLPMPTMASSDLAHAAANVPWNDGRKARERHSWQHGGRSDPLRRTSGWLRRLIE